LSTKGSEKPFSLPFVIFLFGNGGKKADFRSGRLLSGGRAVSLLVGIAREAARPRPRKASTRSGNPILLITYFNFKRKHFVDRQGVFFFY
jgi:hypothetical protein